MVPVAFPVPSIFGQGVSQQADTGLFNHRIFISLSRIGRGVLSQPTIPRSFYVSAPGPGAPSGEFKGLSQHRWAIAEPTPPCSRNWPIIETSRLKAEARI